MTLFLVVFYEPSPSGEVLRQQQAEAVTHDAAAAQIRKLHPQADVVAVLRAVRPDARQAETYNRYA